MRKDIHIRTLAPDEAPVLTEFLYHAIFVQEGVEPPSRSIVKKPELQVYVEDFGSKPDDHALAAEAEGEIIGAVWVRDMPDYGHLEDSVPSFAISLRPEWRNQGIGTLLMRRMLTLLAEKGYAKASLSVQKQNPAVRLYQRLGFQTVGETAEEYLMVCRIHAQNRPSPKGVKQMTEYTIVDNQLTTDDFIRLFAAAGWGELPRDLAEAALQGSWAAFSVCVKGHTIAMARLLGDGAMSFFLKDFVVDPACQGQGIGCALLAHVENYIAGRLIPGCPGYLQLVSAKGKEAFYEKCGYAIHPHDHSGAGMSKWIGE